MQVDTLSDVINETVDSGIEGMEEIYKAELSMDQDKRSEIERLSHKSSAFARAILHTAREIRDKAAARVSMGTQAVTTATIGFWL